MRGRVIDAALGLVIAAGGLFALERGLAWAGLGERPETVNESRGFDPSAAYLVPYQEMEGAWKTQFGEGRGAEKLITPPRPDRIRVELFGGSNTRGFSEVYMGAALTKAAGEEAYEVFNLGRSGYGSERVRYVLEQAVDRTNPDVVVIYSGHNEFVERGFEMDLETIAPRGLLAAPAGAVRRTRLFRTLVASAAPRRSRLKEPRAWKWEAQKFEGTTFDVTQQYFAAYEANLRAMCSAALENGARVLLCTVVHNRLAAPFVSTHDDERTDEQVAACEAKLSQAESLLPAYFGPLLPKSGRLRVHNFDFGPDSKASADGGTLESWQPMTGPLEGRLRLLPREELWATKIRELDRALVRLLRRDLGGRTRNELERAESLLEELLAIEDDHPRAHFLLGLLGYPLDRDADWIHERLETAGAADRAPRKGSDRSNDIVRRVALEIDGVELFDADALFQACHPGGIVGWDWMVDHCHLSVGARCVLLEALAEHLVELWPPSHFTERGE